nr:xylulose kinase-1 [Tanacetum cinerariifolium]
MIAYLTKSDASEGFEQILDFLNASMIQYALTVNPTIYVSCIKQFWSSVSIKKMNDVVHLQALIDRRNVIITKDTVHQALHLDDAESIDCLPNVEIFAEFKMMGYEKPSTKLTFYKAFFSAQWNLVRNVDSSSKFYMYPRFRQLMINAQVMDFLGWIHHLFERMLVPQQVDDVVADDVAADDIADVVADDVVVEDAVEPTLP